MKRMLLALAATAALAAPAGTANAAIADYWVLMCGPTVMTPCGLCVRVNTVVNCTTW